MRVRFYGVRGSTPTSGSSTVRYGGHTSCVEVRLADDSVLVFDCGTGLRHLGKDLMRDRHRGPYHFMLTHVHWDHVIGLPFFGPLWSKDTHIKLYPLANEIQQDCGTRRTLFDGIHFPVRAADIPAHIEMIGNDGAPWRIGSAQVRRVLLNHPGGSQGFRIDDADGSSFAYLTDNELSPPGPPTTSLDELAQFARRVDVMVHDAQYLSGDMPAKHGWGHSTVDDVLRLGARAETPHLILFHHEPDRDDDALDVLGYQASEQQALQAPHTRVSIAHEGWSLDVGQPSRRSPV